MSSPHQRAERSRRGRALSVVAAAAVILGVSVANPAYAGVDETSEVEQVIETSPVAEHFAEAAAQEDAIEGNTVQVSGDTSSVTIDLPVTNGADSETEEGLTSLQDDKSYSIVPAVLDDGSVAIHSVINDSTAPRSYDYVYNLPAGVNLELEEGGGAVAFNPDGSVAVLVAPPWATDANGKSVETSYTVQDNVLTQHVEVDDESEFPIVADPWNGIDLVAKWSFTNVSGSGWRLNVDPTAWARSYTLAPNYDDVGRAGWQELYAKIPAQYEGRLNISGQQQYRCHMGYAGFDPQWNMELWKPSKQSLAAWVATKCN